MSSALSQVRPCDGLPLPGTFRAGGWVPAGSTDFCFPRCLRRSSPPPRRPPPLSLDLVTRLQRPFRVVLTCAEAVRGVAVWGRELQRSESACTGPRVDPCREGANVPPTGIVDAGPSPLERPWRPPLERPWRRPQPPALTSLPASRSEPCPRRDHRDLRRAFDHTILAFDHFDLGSSSP